MRLLAAGSEKSAGTGTRLSVLMCVPVSNYKLAQMLQLSAANRLCPYTDGKKARGLRFRLHLQKLSCACQCAVGLEAYLLLHVIVHATVYFHMR